MTPLLTPSSNVLPNLCSYSLTSHSHLSTASVVCRIDSKRFIPTPRFAWKFSTWNPLSHAEGAYPHNCMLEQPRNQVSEMHVDKFRNPSTFQFRKTSFKTEVCSCSNFTTDAMLWITDVEMVDSVDDLKKS